MRLSRHTHLHGTIENFTSIKYHVLHSSEEIEKGHSQVTTKLKQWSDVETDMLRRVREKLGTKLTARPQFPEAVGDRKLIRFIRVIR